jgi:hypothetical protein
MRELVNRIFNSGSPSQYQEVKMRTIDLLKAMGENISEFERREEAKLARERAEAEKAVRNREIAAQMSKNKDKAQRHYGPLADFQFEQMKSLMKTRLMGQTMTPSNAEVYAELARRANREAARNEEARRRADADWRNLYYGRAAQGGPAPRVPSPPGAAPPPNKNAWKYKPSTEWAPAAPAKYLMLDIPVTATKAEIRKAYKTKVLEYHPNQGGTSAQFQQLQDEYERAMASATGGKRKTRRQSKLKRKTKRRS